MGLFSFGGSKQSSYSSGYSTSRDESLSSSISGGFSQSGGQSTSGQSIAFEDVFSRLYGGAENAASRIDPSVLTEQANLLFGSGTNFLSNLGGGVDSDYLQSRVAGESPVLQEQIDALGADIGKFFQEQVNPAITSEAVAGGALGGGRQGVAQGLAAEAAGREFQRGALGLRSADIAARDAAAAQLGQQRISAAGTGLAALPGLGGIAELGFGAELAPYAALASIIGGPQALTESQSTQFSSSEDFARAFSESFGTSFARNESSSSGKSIKFGF